jgi:hypothetical protein
MSLGSNQPEPNSQREGTEESPAIEYLTPEEYEYSPLDNGRKEIRLLALLPGSSDDPIEIEIWHEPLQMPPKVSSTRFPIEELEKTLPRNWKVFENIEHRLFFWNTCTEKATFEHPDTAFHAVKHTTARISIC